MRPIVFLFLTFFQGCGASQVPYGDGPVDFSFQLDEEEHFLGELRGGPVLLVLMRTSEATSDMHVLEVQKAFAQSAGITRFLVLSIEPNDAPTLDYYREFHELPFPVGLAEYNVALGNTVLGVVPVMPCTYLINGAGVVEGVYPGVTSAEKLVALVKELEAR